MYPLSLGVLVLAYLVLLGLRKLSYRAMVLLFLTFLTTLTAYIPARDRYLEYEKSHAEAHHLDRARGVWKPAYDWRASNRRTDLLHRISQGMAYSLLTQSFVCAFLSFMRAKRRWTFLLVGLGFLAFGLCLAAALVLGSVAMTRMIG